LDDVARSMCRALSNGKEALPQFPLPPEMALELLMAANFLDV